MILCDPSILQSYKTYTSASNSCPRSYFRPEKELMSLETTITRIYNILFDLQFSYQSLPKPVFDEIFLPVLIIGGY